MDLGRVSLKIGAVSHLVDTAPTALVAAGQFFIG
jgi:hypothetical protein